MIPKKCEAIGRKDHAQTTRFMFINGTEARARARQPRLDFARLGFAAIALL
jgi:hypothetical protein